MPRDQAFAPVGVILLVGITIALAGGALTVIHVDGPSQDPVAVGFLLREGERLEIVKTGGEALDAASTTLLVGTPQGDASIAADRMPGIGDRWANGQTACLAGEGPRCLQIAGAQEILDVRVVHQGQLVFQRTGETQADLAAGSGPRIVLGGSQDPGHAYEDVDDDGVYVSGVDVAIPDAEIHDGTYQVQDPWGLVIPASVGPIDAERVRLSAGDDGHVTIEVDVTSEEEGIEIAAGDGVNAEDVTFTSGDEDVVLDAGEGALELDGASFDTADQRVELRTEDALRADKVTFTADQERVVVDAGGSVDLEGARIAASERVSITAGGDVNVRGTLLSAQEEITIDTVETATVDVEGARIEDADDTAILTPEAATIDGEPAEGSVEHP